MDHSFMQILFKTLHILGFALIRRWPPHLSPQIFDWIEVTEMAMAENIDFVVTEAFFVWILSYVLCHCLVGRSNLWPSPRILAEATRLSAQIARYLVEFIMLSVLATASVRCLSFYASLFGCKHADAVSDQNVGII